MDITVSMKEEEFLEFMAWRKDRQFYANKMVSMETRMTRMANKIRWAITKETEPPNRVKIEDQDHATELLEMAEDFLA